MNLWPLAPRNSAHGEYDIGCQIYLKEIRKVLVKLQENWVKSGMICRKPCLDDRKDENLRNKFDTIKSHMYPKLCAKFQAPPVTAAYMAEILMRA